MTLPLTTRLNKQSLPQAHDSTSVLELLLSHDQEFALVDIRERGEQAEDGHIIHSAPLPLGQLELEARHLLPSRSTQILVIDADGGALASRAVSRLQELGYRKVSMLEGGVAAWKEAGQQVYTGVSAYSKAFGEYVEHEYATPAISATELKAKVDAQENVLVLDGRSQPEFLNFSLPFAYSVPNAELPYRVHSVVPDKDALVVVNCAGRTRSIIGAQALINAGIENRVVALRNGTMDWLKLGFDLQTGTLRQVDAPTGPALDKARQSVELLTQRYELQWIDTQTLEDFVQQRDDHALYVFDVRTKEEFESGHLPGAQWVEGGELVQWLDHHIAVRNARIVLVDDEHGVRAAITASWLRQLNVGRIHALRTSPQQRTEVQSSNAAESQTPSVATLTLGQLQQALQSNEVFLIDVSSSKEFVQAHIPGAVFRLRSRLDAEELRTEADGRNIVLTSPDGKLAAWAAHDLRQHFPGAAILAGGNQSWLQAELNFESGDPSLPTQARDIEPSPYHAQEDRFAAFDAYLAWEIELLGKIEKDATVRFLTFERPARIDFSQIGIV